MTRDIGKEILEGIQTIKAGEGKRTRFDVPGDIVQIRNSLHLSQKGFSTLLGVSERTLQEWEQGRRKPTGPACALLRVAQKHPEAFLDI
jgi:putative transcriptional regulator